MYGCVFWSRRSVLHCSSINSMHKTLAETHSSQDRSRFFLFVFPSTVVGEVRLGEKTWRGFLLASVKERIEGTKGSCKSSSAAASIKNHKGKHISHQEIVTCESRAGTECDRVDWHSKCRRADEALISCSAVMVQADTTRMRIPPWI
ncbi:hypothetical protein MUK42_25177 [Musa troglodytarum]|uniref:Uncharacterized protein n=1 Tax=Musa troglodytarum TaxID=320322 RepID=A0A9E7KM23_9LILI|nr:hypothetical protein MUK42_25177 [Musa troglodytarum]